MPPVPASVTARINELFYSLNKLAEKHLQGDGFFGVVGLNFGGLITVHPEKTKQLDTLARAFMQKEGGSGGYVAHVGPAGVEFEKQPEANPVAPVDLDAVVEDLVARAKSQLLKDRDRFSSVGLMTVSNGASGVIDPGPAFGEAWLDRAQVMFVAGRRAAEVCKPHDLLQFAFVSECWFYPTKKPNEKTPGLVFHWVRVGPEATLTQGQKSFSVIEAGRSLDLVPCANAGQHKSPVVLNFVAGFYSARTADPFFAEVGNALEESAGVRAFGGKRAEPS